MSTFSSDLSPLGVRVGVGKKAVRVNGRRAEPRSWPAATARCCASPQCTGQEALSPMAPTPEKPHHDWRVVACGPSLIWQIVTSSGHGTEISLDWRRRKRQAVRTK